ncbi:TetR/AcrR family transcriptional regulator [Kineosporia sp. A_224]|uniref:TetR/AcrR family transcriptional regulator n=1 Tax=Kineosporia sp. A_224 TaxID=1962180 RepID=UPI0018E9A00C|nr:TetR/AcrR family transcriptional regulator [Kineosporia sp. A_224]
MPQEKSVEDRPVLGVRARARVELTRAIVETARRHLAQDGPANLSLRAVARELGMVSSAVYRYVPSRDDLLTLLIIEAYDALGAAAEKAEAKVPRTDLDGRFVAVGRAVRTWAIEHPHEYALIYGSPVPGYAAPQDTIAPATRVPAILIGVLADAVAAGVYDPAAAPEVPAAVRRSLGPVRAAIPDVVPDDLVVRGIMAWSTLLGLVSMEQFGQFHNVLAEAASQREAFFTEALRRTSAVTTRTPAPRP